VFRASLFYDRFAPPNHLQQGTKKSNDGYARGLINDAGLSCRLVDTSLIWRSSTYCSFAGSGRLKLLPLKCSDELAQYVRLRAPGAFRIVPQNVGLGRREPECERCLLGHANHVMCLSAKCNGADRQVRYALIVSLRASVQVDLYTPIETAVGIPVEVEV
jgi:hypothetical protein